MISEGFLFFFLAAEWLQYRRRPPIDGHRPAIGPLFADPIGDINAVVVILVIVVVKRKVVKRGFRVRVCARRLMVCVCVSDVREHVRANVARLQHLLQGHLV